MPGYIIHLVEAKLVLEGLYEKKYSLALNMCAEESQNQWRELFYCGTLLPDAVLSEEKKRSHWWRSEGEEKVFQIPNLAEFEKENEITLNNPAVCGYYIHLYLDHKFYEEFLPQFIELRDKNGRIDGSARYSTDVYLRRSQELITKERFFSEEYLYGDYTKLNAELVKQHQLILPDWKQIPTGELLGIQFRAVEAVALDLKKYMCSDKETDNTLKVIPWMELESFLQKTAEKAIEKLVMQDVL